MPLFSIIIPTYNRAKHISVIVDDVINQTCQDFEILIIDDGTDETDQIIRAYNDPRIVFFRRNQRMGVSSARNFGAEKSTGTYLAFLDDDDQIEKNWLSDFQSLITAKQSPDILCCNMRVINPLVEHEKIVQPTDHGNGAVGWAIIIPGGFIVKRDLFLKVGGYDQHILYGENTELFIRFQLNAPTCAYTGNVNFIYKPSTDGGSKNLINKLDSNMRVLEKHPSYFLTRKGLKKSYLRVAAVAAARLGKYSTARQLFKAAVDLDKKDIKTWVQYLLSVNEWVARRKWKKAI